MASKLNVLRRHSNSSLSFGDDPVNLLNNRNFNQVAKYLRSYVTKLNEDHTVDNRVTEEQIYLKSKFKDYKNKRTVQVGKQFSMSTEHEWNAFESVYASDLLPADAGACITAEFLTELVEMLIDYVHKQATRTTKVLDFHQPNTLKETLGHYLEIPESPRDLEEILSDCKETLKYSVKTGHPRFFNQLSTGLDVISLAGEWLTATANTNMFTYEIAPVFTLMEEVTLQKLCDCVGWPDGDGIFTPGGSISTLYGILCARYHAYPEVKHKGLKDLPQLVVLTSEHAHYSVNKAASICGLGLDNVILVRCDSRGKMNVDNLEFKINEVIRDGKVPIAVSATAGTTVLGAFDPIEHIADICEKYCIWLHVDAAWGGGVLLSKEHRHLVKGIERADSVTWNPHKAMGVTLQCSAILLKQKEILLDCNAMYATYLFQQDKQYDCSYDTGDKTIQCGRHNDVFKLWLMWRAKGDEGFEQQMQKLFELAQYTYNKILNLEGFELVIKQPEYLNISFWYIPKQFRKLHKGPMWNEKINQVAPQIKAMMMESGTSMCSYQPLDNHPNFFRMILSNLAIKHEDIEYFLEEVARFGEECNFN